MTFKEKYETEYADKIQRDNEKFPYYGCPSEYYDDPDKKEGMCPALSCEECWKREESEGSASEKGAAVGEKVRAGFDDALKDVGTTASKATEAMKKLTEAAAATPRILDSGNRRQFETGAVRDICEGKGRCDLLPLDVVAETMNNFVIRFIYLYQVEDGDYERLFDALMYSGIFPDLPTLMLEVAKHFEEGCKKYGDNNWQKGIPTHCYVDSAVRHYLKYLRGDKDEPHDRAFCWNIMCCIWTCIHKPELNDYAKKEADE